MKSWLEVRQGNLRLNVIDAGAQYPLTVDPVVQLAELSSSDGALKDNFGYAVAASGNTIVVGAPFATVNGASRQGAVYVFVEPTSGWQNATETAKLVVHDGENSQFGGTVGISGDTVIVGELNGGNAYVFTKPASGWSPVAPVLKLSTPYTPGDGFGYSVAVGGNTIVVGAPFTGQFNDAVGAAYLYVKPSGGWRSVTTYTSGLAATDGSPSDYFGTSLAVAGNSVVVGAPGSRTNRRGGLCLCRTTWRLAHRNVPDW